jgi:hypothetical protein
VIWSLRNGNKVLRFETALEMRVGFEEAIATRAPCSRASWATANPIPEEPPIIRIDWPLIEGMVEKI